MEQLVPKRLPVLRENKRFRYYTNDIATIPEGYCAPLDMRTTRELIDERIRTAVKK